ncbi:importin-4-like [Haliotis cracherodii]|uniref:importin-4-like n=1 Tax=Haliotis cracherodii TaxID=6455 RepID=UPI0039E7F8D4
MAAPLEAILAKLLQPDNAVIQEATQSLREAFKDPSALGSLCQVLATSQTPQIRQYAAVLLRRKIQKSKQWKALTEDVRQSIRDNILQLLVQESEKGVRNAVAQIVGTVAKHDLATNSWPQVFDFMITTTKDPDVAKRELGAFVLYTVCSVACEQLKPHLRSVLQLLTELINDSQSRQVPYYAVRSMTELVFFVGDDESKFIQSSVPRVVQIVRELALQDEDKACEVMELFDELLETEVAIIMPHIRLIVEFSLELAANGELGDSVRVKGMSFISSLTRLKKKAIMKQKLVPAILQVMFTVMTTTEEDDDTEEDEDVESHSPGQYAPQVIDTLALHLPPDKLVPEVMPLVESGLASDKPGFRKAAYIAMAVIAEGCADYIMSKHLKAILQCVCKGLNDPDPIVRNSALFALGQFSEHLQPNISKFASELLPLLFQYLGRATQEADKNPKGLTKSYYALEMFIENLEKEILPFLPNLMEHLLMVLKSSPSMRAKELAISALGAAALAAKEGLVPYFQEVMDHFKVYLTAVDNEDMRKLQIQTIDTLGVLARSVGDETFLPLCKECIQFGINLLENADDPDVRRCVYSLFAAVSNLLKGEMGSYLAKIVHYMLLSVKSNEGVTPHFKEEAEQVAIFNDGDFQDEEDIGDDDEEDDDNNKIDGISVENSYLDEKEDACTSLGELAVNCGSVFLPYLETSYTEVLGLIEFPAPGVKKGAISSLSQFCLCVFQVFTETQSPETKTALSSMMPVVIQKLLEVVKTDMDRTVVMAAVDALHDMLEKIEEPVLSESGSTDAILTTVKEIFTHKLACQDQEDEDDDETQAEYDGMLIESAGDVLPVMARLLGGQQFLPFFSSFLTDLLKRLKETSSTSEKSFAVGTLAETIEACGPTSVAFVDTLYPVFVRMIREEDDEVRSNAVYALGVLAMYGGEKMQVLYKDILKMLFDILNKETNGRVMDNIAAASCRLIMANKDQVPLEHVVPVIMQCLPLKEDMEEWTTIFTCLLQLYSQGNEHVIKLLPQILKLIASILGSDTVKQDIQQLLVQFVQTVASAYPAVFTEVKTSVEPEQANKLDMCVAMVAGSPTG